VRSFLDRGGSAIFLPPRAPGNTEFLGTRWTSWSGGTNEVAVENWRGDEGLLAHTQSGTPLPVGGLLVKRSCGLAGELTPLATLRGGAPLLARATTDRGGAYFCATTPAVGDSSLATEGVVLYVLVQRAAADGVAALGGTRQLSAGDPGGEKTAGWSRVAGADDAVSTEYTLHRGVYNSGGRLLAVNRPAAEDGAAVLVDGRVGGLFRGLDFSRVDESAGGTGSLLQEIWPLFLAAVMAALLLEAALCLPKPARLAGARS
jgi:hypothetical protein